MAHPKVAPDHKAPEGQDVRQEANRPARQEMFGEGLGLGSRRPLGYLSVRGSPDGRRPPLPRRSLQGPLPWQRGQVPSPISLTEYGTAGSLLPGAFSGRSARPPDARLDTLFRSVRPQRGRLPSPCLPSATRQKG
jgi:hypothetical protein